jgi:hypothetical protein
LIAVAPGIALFTTADGSLHALKPPRTSPWVTGRVTSRIEAEGEIFVRAIRPDQIATVRVDGVLAIWNLTTKLLVREIDLGGRVTAFDYAENTCVFAMEDGRIIICDFGSHESKTIGEMAAVEVRKDSDGVWVRTKKSGWVMYKGGEWYSVTPGDKRYFYLGKGRFAHWEDGKMVVMARDGTIEMEFKSDVRVTAFALHEGGKLAIIGTEAGTISVCRQIS